MFKELLESFEDIFQPYTEDEFIFAKPEKWRELYQLVSSVGPIDLSIMDWDEGGVEIFFDDEDDDYENIQNLGKGYQKFEKLFKAFKAAGYKNIKIQRGERDKHNNSLYDIYTFSTPAGEVDIVMEHWKNSISGHTFEFVRVQSGSFRDYT